MFQEVRKRLSNIQQSYLGHMDLMLAELNKAEAELTHLRVEVERLKPLAEIGEAMKWATEHKIEFVRLTSSDTFVDKGDLEILMFMYRKQKDGEKIDN